MPTTSRLFTCKSCGEEFCGLGPGDDPRREAMHLCLPCFLEHVGLHPESCACRGTGCRFVGEVMIDEPCEEPPYEEDEDPSVAWREDLQDWEASR